MDSEQKRFVKIIETYGYAKPSDSRWFRALLRDLRLGTPQQIHALAIAAADGIPTELSSLVNDPHAKLRATQLQARLKADHGWETDLAKWTIETWAAAIQSSNENGKPLKLKCPDCGRSLQVTGRSIGEVIICAEKACGVKLRIFAEGREVTIELSDDEKQSVSVVVATDGTGQFKSLEEALSKVPEDTHLVLRGGPFEGTILITRPTTIVGANPQGRVVIQSQKGPCFLIKSGSLRLVNLSIEMSSTLTGARKPVLEVTQGEVEVEKCQFRTRVADAVSIHGSAASASFHQCEFMSEKGRGVFVWDRAKAVFSDCSIKDTRGIGVSVETGARVKLLGCHVEGSKYLGVQSRNSDLRIEHCQITKALQNGLEISGGTFVMVQSAITGNGARGLWVHDKAVGTIDGCDLTANKTGGKSISSDSQVTLQGIVLE